MPKVRETKHKIKNMGPHVKQLQNIGPNVTKHSLKNIGHKETKLKKLNIM